MKRVLIVVDVQNDFVDGVLGSKEAQAIIPAVKAKIEKYDKYGREILFTRDSHDGDYLYTSEGRKLPIKHCIMGTRGHRIVDGLETHNSRHIDKPTFGYTGWAEVLDMLGDPDSIEMIGLDTDICVVTNALIIKTLNPDIEITVDASCCAGSTPEKHKAALEVLKSCQIEVIGEKGYDYFGWYRSKSRTFPRWDTAHRFGESSKYGMEKYT